MGLWGGNGFDLGLAIKGGFLGVWATGKWFKKRQENEGFFLVRVSG